MEQHRPVRSKPDTRGIPDEEISTARVLKALFLTFLSLFAIVLWGYHSVWAVKVIFYNMYGNLLNNLVFGPGTLIAHGGLSIKLITYLNVILLDDKIDADHKKYL